MLTAKLISLARSAVPLEGAEVKSWAAGVAGLVAGAAGGAALAWANIGGPVSWWLAVMLRGVPGSDGASALLGILLTALPIFGTLAAVLLTLSRRISLAAKLAVWGAFLGAVLAYNATSLPDALRLLFTTGSSMANTLGVAVLVVVAIVAAVFIVGGLIASLGMTGGMLMEAFQGSSTPSAVEAFRRTRPDSARFATNEELIAAGLICED